MIPEVTIIIVNWNTKELLKNCLESLVLELKNIPSEIILVDNASSDGSVEMCQSLFPEVQIIRNSNNVGFGPANNQGIAASKAALVLLLNSDTVLLPQSIEKMTRSMHEDPTIGVLGCRLLNRDGSYQLSCMKFPTPFLVLVQELMLYKLSKKFPRIFIEPPYLNMVIDCDWVFGTVMMIRKNALEISGLFDPRIWMYSEEMELCYRIRAAGWRVVFYPEVRVIHFGEGSWKEKSYSPTFFKMKGLLYFFKKHFSSPVYFIVYSLVTVGAALRLFLWVIWIVINMARGRQIDRGVLEARSNWSLLAKLLWRLPPLLYGITSGRKDADIIC